MTRKIEYYYTIDANVSAKTEIIWVLSIFAQYCDIIFTKLEGNSNNSAIKTISHNNGNITVNMDFFEAIYDYQKVEEICLDDSMNILNPNGSIDFISTSFYFLNCLWERKESSEKDNLSRSDFDGSIWQKHGFDRPFNKVNLLFEEMAKSLNIEVVKRKSLIYLSHDIDNVNGAIIQDGYSLFKTGRFIRMGQLLWEHVFKKPHWFNFKEIAQLEKKYNAVSTFFWIVTKKNTEKWGKNADYNIHSKKIVKEIEWLKENDFESGLHKSLHSQSMKTEKELFPTIIRSNRYHYLKFAFPDLIKEVESATIDIDASLGYARVSGFRNGYSLPFRPFNLDQKREATFLEVPLTIMDGTYSKYKNVDADKAYDEIIEIIENNKENGVISILWHNSHFTDYKFKGYPNLYERLLQYLRKENHEFIDNSSLIKLFK